MREASKTNFTSCTFGQIQKELVPTKKTNVNNQQKKAWGNYPPAFLFMTVVYLSPTARDQITNAQVRFRFRLSPKTLGYISLSG